MLIKVLAFNMYITNEMAIKVLIAWTKLSRIAVVALINKTMKSILTIYSKSWDRFQKHKHISVIVNNKDQVKYIQNVCNKKIKQLLT